MITEPDRCTDCMVGQGRRCHCATQADYVAMRWAVLTIAVFWALVAVVVGAWL